MMILSAIASRRLIRLTVGLSFMLSGAFQVSAQQDELSPPKAEVKGTIGGSTFGDGEVPHGVFGGSVRVYLNRRVSVEPEFLYMYHSVNDQDFILQPNLAVDLTSSKGRVVPYLIAGAGVIHHRGRFTTFDFNGPSPVLRTVNTSGTSWTASAGGGVKLFITDRLFVAPEARIGFEPVLRGTISVGYVFSGRERN